MYQYEYVEAELDGFFTVANYREIINQYAKEGWKLVQILPVNYNSHGRPRSLEIIFEREVKDE